WMYSVISYFKLNDHVYDSDKKRFITALNFMNKGTAACYKAAENKGWGKWTDFTQSFKTAFVVSDIKGTVLTKLTSLTQ
ncbi:hypothetical protein BS17DRAFT_714646, partial [Gyrodon lividus]